MLDDPCHREDLERLGEGEIIRDMRSREYDIPFSFDDTLEPRLSCEIIALHQIYVLVPVGEEDRAVAAEDDRTQDILAGDPDIVR